MIKQKFIVAMALTAMMTTTVNARSWRINNDVTKKADFTDLNAAMSSTDVMAGDTLYMDPGCILNSKQTVSKRVTIVGSGYFRNDAPHRLVTISGNLYLTAQYIKVEGIAITGTTYLCSDYITVERCKAGNISINENWTTAAAQFATIRQCYATSVHGGSNLSYPNKTSFATIENCILMSNNGSPIDGLYSPTIRNCYLKYSGTSTSAVYAPLNGIDNASITNNIILRNSNPSSVLNSVTNSFISNNVMSCAETTYSSIGENRYMESGDESLVFALEGANDERYQLKADSPAKGYATDGGDCGPFGGLYPYVLGGMPKGYPYYTKAVIDARAKDGKVNVSLNIKMQDE